MCLQWYLFHIMLQIGKESPSSEIPVDDRYPIKNESPIEEMSKYIKPDKSQGHNATTNFKIRQISFLNNQKGNFISGEKVLNNLYQRKSKNFVDVKLSNINPKVSDQLLSSNSPTLKENGGSRCKEETDESYSFDNMGNSISTIAHEVTQNEEKHILEALSNHFVFKDINQELLSLVLNDLIYFSFDKGQTIYAEGDEGNYFYIIAEGKVESSAKGKKHKIYGKWDCFGELSLIARCKREETLTCLEKVVHI